MYISKLMTFELSRLVEQNKTFEDITLDSVKLLTAIFHNFLIFNRQNDQLIHQENNPPINR